MIKLFKNGAINNNSNNNRLQSVIWKSVLLFPKLRIKTFKK